ncbi:MAG: alpha/beta hydrolase [Candidatus Peribacteraceae bacterium]|nr:alpha/beta hydrolase [Candidatus Peribacteraceae bacterium]
MEKTKPNIILIHGNNGGEAEGGRGDDYWFPYAVQEFEKMGCKVTAKTFPDPCVASSSIWLPFIKNECSANENSILIGHSSGAIAAMRYAENNKILGSVLVGTYHSDIGDENERQSGYFENPWDWDVIKKNQKWIIQFSSEDDPYFSFEEPMFVYEKLNTELHKFEDRGHFFNLEFPELVEAVKQKLI